MAYLSNTCSFEDWMTENESEGQVYPSPEMQMVAQEMVEQGHDPDDISMESIQYYLSH